MKRSAMGGLLGTLVMVGAAAPSCGGSGVGGGVGTTGDASCSSVCQSGQNAAPSLGCGWDNAECLDECGLVQQNATAIGCTAEFNALASCMVSGGAAAWECDPGDDSMEPADEGPCLSQAEALDSCESSGVAEGGCTNTCEYANDGECDDGGPESLYDYCALGTDCADCGPR